MRHLVQPRKPPRSSAGRPGPAPRGCPWGAREPLSWGLPPQAGPGGSCVPPTSPPWHAAPRSPPGLGTVLWHGSRHRQAARGRPAARQRCALALRTLPVPVLAVGSRVGQGWGRAGSLAGGFVTPAVVVGCCEPPRTHRSLTLPLSSPVAPCPPAPWSPSPCAKPPGVPCPQGTAVSPDPPSPPRGAGCAARPTSPGSHTRRGRRGRWLPPVSETGLLSV